MHKYEIRTQKIPTNICEATILNLFKITQKLKNHTKTEKLMPFFANFGKKRHKIEKLMSFFAKIGKKPHKIRKITHLVISLPFLMNSLF